MPGPMPIDAAPPGPPAGGPPPSPPPGGSPSPGGDEQAMAAVEQEAEAQRQAMAEAAPVVNNSIPSKLLDDLAKAITKVMEAANKAFEKAGQPPLPPLNWQPLAEKSFTGKLPVDIWGPVAVLAQTAMTIEGGAYASKLGFDPRAMTDSGGIKKAIAKLTMMAGNKKFIAAIAGPPPGEQGEPAPEPKGGPPPGEEAPLPEDDIMMEAAR